ncbi:MAG: glutathione S-transferase [Henriciella sp.]|nr:glutathione S-transferase [Henriciella sp.]
MSDTLPILYSFRRCPYAMRARMAIAVSGMSCRLREVVLRDKPEEMLAASPKGTVPVIVEADGRVIDESLDVMLWSLEQNDPDQWLSTASGTLAQMQELIAVNDGPFKQALDRYKYPNRYDNVDPIEQRAKGVAFLKTLDERLSHTPFLFGDQVSLADIAIFPFIRQFANTDRAWFDAQPLPNLQAWLAGHLDSALFVSIMPKFKQWQTGDDEPIFP